MLHEHVMKHFAIANLHGNRAILADLIKKDIERFTLDLRKVSDLCGHSWAYLPALGALLAIQGPVWTRLCAYINRRRLDKRRCPSPHRRPRCSGWCSGGRVSAMGKERQVSVWCYLRLDARRLCSRRGERH